MLGLLLLPACAAPKDEGAAEKHPPLSPVFLPIEEGLAEAIEPLAMYSVGWIIDAQGDFLFAKYHRYILRYDITSNQIDKVVDLEEPEEHCFYPSSISPDGRYCVVYTTEIPGNEFDEPVDKILIDFKQETFERTNRGFYPYNGVHDKGYQMLLDITAVNAPELSPGDVAAIDENRVGALLPGQPHATGLLGYYKFAVIDAAKDEIIQTCPMNVLQSGQDYSIMRP